MTGLSVFQVVILGIYGLAAWFLMERDDRRGLGWICLSALVYLVTSEYWRLGFPEPALVSGVLDGAVCIAIYLFGRYRWELLIWRYYQFFVLVNMLRLAGYHNLFPVAPSEVYSGLLEATNILIALTIGGVALGKGVGDAWELDGFGNHLRRLVGALRQERPVPPFHKIAG